MPGTGKLPSIKVYLISMNLALLLMFAIISLLFWQQIIDFRERDHKVDIEAIQSAMQARSASQVRSMAMSAHQAVAGYDFSFLNTLIQQVANDDEEILYCLVVNKAGLVVAHNRPNQVGSAPKGIVDQQALALMDSEFAHAANGSSPVKIIHATSNLLASQGEIMEVVTPVFSGQTLWGILLCGFSMERLQEHIESREKEWDLQLAQTRFFYLSMVVMFLLFGFLIALLITKRLLSAVSQLNTGVVKVSEGDLNFRLEMHGLFCSEFASFASSFNQMTYNLETSRRQLDEYNRSLEKKVNERTIELERSNKELESFNYSVSHDLRAPLRSIDGFSQALTEEYQEHLDETGHDYLRRVRRAAKHMGDLIDDLLRLSRLGRLEMSVELVDLSEMATRALGNLQESDTHRTVTWQVEPELKAHGDKHLLGIALNNLIGNAWKYSSRRKHAEIEFGKLVQDGRTLFYVHDNGAGFNMKYANKLFGAFQRLHTNSEFEGTGIGLATVARIIHRHGGSVWAESEVDRGATFYFELPE
jgi:signal transduction histidine kinase